MSIRFNMHKKLGVLLLLTFIAGQSFAMDPIPPAKILKCKELFRTFRQGTVAKRNSTLTAPKRDPKSFESMIARFPADERQRWIQARGEEHIEKIKAYAHEVAKSLKALENKAADSVKNSYAGLGEVFVRAKSENSILAKLLRKDYEAFKKEQAGINNVKQALAALGDGIGTRIILKTTPEGKIAPETIQAFVDQVSKDIKDGTRVTEILNYRVLGNKGMPYLSDAQIAQIVQADRDYRLGLQKLKDAGKEVKIPDPIIVKNSPETGFEDGYTSFHMNIQYQSGVQAELQLRGPNLHQVTETEHLFYDLKSGKVLSEENAKNPKIVKAANSYQSLSPENKAKMDKYFEQQMIHARQIESGQSVSSAPQLPEGIPSELSFENLKPIILHD